MDQVHDMVPQRGLRLTPIALVSFLATWAYTYMRQSFDLSPPEEADVFDDPVCSACEGVWCAADATEDAVNGIMDIIAAALTRYEASVLRVIRLLQFVYVVCFLLRMSYWVARDGPVEATLSLVRSLTWSAPTNAMTSVSQPQPSRNQQSATDVNRNSNGVKTSTVKKVNADGWSRRLHDQIFGALEFEVVDVCERVRHFMKVFDVESAFGRAAIDLIRKTCQPHLPSGALPGSEAGLTALERSKMAEMWELVKKAFADILIDGDDGQDDLRTMEALHKQKFETWTAFLTRAFVAYEVTIKKRLRERRAVEIVLTKLDQRFLDYMKGQCPVGQLTLKTMSQIAQIYDGWNLATRQMGPAMKVHKVDVAEKLEERPNEEAQQIAQVTHSEKANNTKLPEQLPKGRRSLKTMKKKRMRRLQARNRSRNSDFLDIAITAKNGDIRRLIVKS